MSGPGADTPAAVPWRDAAAAGRVSLRPAVPADGAAVVAANRASAALHHPWSAPATEAAAFDAWLSAALAGPGVALVAHERATGALVGTVTLSGIVMGAFRCAFMGWNGHLALAGRGLMTEAAALAVRHAFEAMGLHRLEANIQPGNGRSLALARRLGFRCEGFSPRYLRVDGAWRDHERWALLAEEEG